MIIDRLELVDARGAHHVPDAEVLKLANDIAEAFVTMRPQYIPGHVSIPRKSHIKFYEAARLCRQQRLTAEQFVAQQLKGMALLGGLFYPMGIAKQYESESAHNGRCVGATEIYKSQLVIYKARSSILTPRLLLEDDRGPFTPLFRLAMAYELDYQDLVTQLRPVARLEFLATPGSETIFPHLKGMMHD